MNKFVNVSAEDKPFLARLEDAVLLAEQRFQPRFLGFLDERQQRLAGQALGGMHFEQYRFYGGHPDAQKKFLAIWPAYGEPSDEEFPIVALTFVYRKEDALSHRDFYGALLHLGVKKESIGDILTGEGIAVAFLTEPVAALAQGEIRKIGRTGVSVERGVPETLPQAYTLVPADHIVSSSRLDCVVAAATKKSRSQASQYIQGGNVSLNFTECTEVARDLQEDDILSIRGFGRFIYRETGTRTKKGRLKVTIYKFT